MAFQVFSSASGGEEKILEILLYFYRIPAFFHNSCPFSAMLRSVAAM